MRRRIGFTGVAVAAASLIVGVGMALAAGQKQPTAPKPKSVLLSCHGSPTTVAPPGQPAVDQPNGGGAGYGPVTCSSTSFGSGIMWDRFTIAGSGDMVGTYKDYFKDGELTGTFDLQPTESPPLTATSFYSESFAGKVLVTGGTAVDKGIVSKNHKGTMTCNSPDSVHFACVEHVKILIPPTATSGTTGTTGSQG